MRISAHGQQRRLRLVLAGVFVLLLAPAIVLAWLGYRQLQFEAFFQQQALAAELTGRVDRRLTELFAAQDELSFVDFSFLIVGEGNYVQRSPLSEFPVNTNLPGLIGYFQVDADGTFSTPILPLQDSASPVALDPEDQEQRRAAADRLLALLTNLDADSGLVEQGEDVREKRAANDNPAARPVANRAQPVPSDSPEMLPGGFADSLDVNVPTDAVSELSERDDESAAQPYRQQSRKRDVETDAQPTPRGATQAVVRRTVAAPQSETEPMSERLAELRSQPDPDPAPVAIAAGQAVFDQLEEARVQLGTQAVKVAELKLKEGYGSKDEDWSPASPASKLEQRTRRLEKNLEPAIEPESADPTDTRQKLTSFVSEVEPFRVDIIDAQHLLLHRNVWREQRRVVQGAVIERSALLEATIGDAFRGTGLASVTSLLIAFKGDVLHSFRAGSPARHPSQADDISRTLLYQTSLTAPLNNFELIFSFGELPTGPGGVLIGWTSGVFLLLLCGGFALLYRLGRSQITLADQQQDFVAAVSHELKTPLTSIRMYGEILKAGWASEEKKRSYYDFIFAESERLTRLINNVLRLARINRNGGDLELRRRSVGELVDLARSKCTTQLEQAGFELEEHHQALDAELNVDADAFVQIMINLVDNAIKFSAASDRRSVRFSTRLQKDRVEFIIRDYGPGVPKNQLRKIFQLFYRTERELTRETVGTGIGLALVHELVTAMDGTVDVANADPGAEFRVYLPLAG